MADSVHQAAPWSAAPNEARGTLPIFALGDPKAIAWDAAVSRNRGIYGFDSIDARSRSFNMVRARLLELNAERGWRMIGVVSATPNVGKSFISANVAAALSRDPRFTTHVVDLDLRRGSLSQLFDIVPERGLNAYLEGACRSPDTYKLEGERLVIVPTLAGRLRSAELLANSQAQTLLRSMRGSDEKSLFIVDLPPVFANDDAATVMARLDAYILVAEEGKTKQREIRDAVSLLGANRLAGVILNKYRGGLMSEGYGIADYYAFGYGDGPGAGESDRS